MQKFKPENHETHKHTPTSSSSSTEQDIQLYKGVREVPANTRFPYKRYSAKVKHDKQTYSLGLFDTPTEAAIAHDLKAFEFYLKRTNRPRW